MLGRNDVQLDILGVPPDSLADYLIPSSPERFETAEAGIRYCLIA
jgi:hypothetical protein